MRQEAKPRKPTLSPTKITTYLACALKYRWTYIDWRGKRYLRAKHYYSFGATLHKVLERFHDAGDVTVQTASDAVVAVEKEWIAAGFESKEAETAALSAGKEMLERYVAQAIEAPSEAKTLFTEKMLRADLGPFVLIGRLDRVDEHPDGLLEVVDYKSGRSEVTPEEVASDIAMTCYQLLVRRNFPDRAVSASILAIRTGSKATVSLSESEIAEFEGDLLTLGQEILSAEWNELTPEVKPVCYGCDFVELCREHAEFEEAWRAALAQLATE